MHSERWFDVVRMRLRSLFHRGAVERELDRELQFHLDLEIQKNLRRGLTPREARAAALRRLGGIAQIQEECRDMRRTSYLENFLHDLPYAGRTLAKSPAFTLSAIATLALGIGANTAIFQLLNAVRLRSLPVPQPHALAQIRIPNLNFGISEGSDNLSFPLFEQIREHQQAFSGVFAWNTGYTSLRIGQGAGARRATVMGVSGEFFSTLELLPAAGRLFRSADDLRGCPSPTIVLSYPFWQREFGGSLSAIGSRLVVLEHPLEIIGVAPDGFLGPEVGSHFDLALPLCSISVLNNGDTPFERRDYAGLTVMGRLKPGWTLARATEHMRAISPGLMQATIPSGYSRGPLEDYLRYRLQAIPGATGVSGLREQYDRSLLLLLCVTGLVLLIACANLSNLMLARAGAREREFAVRLALGAARTRLISQTLTEGLLLAGMGAASGLTLASLLSRAILHFLETSENRLHLDLTPDWRLLLFTAAVASLTCILLSLAPALRASRGQPAEAMKSGTRGLTTDRSRFAFQRLLVVLQVSISLILVAGAFLFAASFRRLVTLDPGFRAQGLLQASFELGKQNSQETVVRQLLAEVRATPQVESAAATTNFLISSGMWSLVVRSDAMTRDSRFTWVSPGFFPTLGTPLLKGRDFNPNDVRTSPKVAVVNEVFARLYFPASDPIGKTFRTLPEPDYPEAEYEIVGLAKNTRYLTLQAAEPPMVYAPVTQFPLGVAGTMIFIRSSAPLSAVEAAVRSRIAAWRPGTEVEVHRFQQIIADSLIRERLLAVLSGFFGLLAALLATIGLYGILAYQTVRRRNEIGIRLALGATRARVIQLILREAALLVSVGLLIGLVGALAIGEAASSLLFDISARDPFQLAAAALALAVAAAIGSIVPARHASRLDPMHALREE